MFNLPAIVLLFIFSVSGCSPATTQQPEQIRRESSPDNYSTERRRMVDLIRARGIKKKEVLDAMLKVPRHNFVPQRYADQAYNDHPLPIGSDQTISQPYIVAYMTDAANISASSRVLEIGTGSGYQAAILGEIAKEVYTIEIIPELADRAKETLDQLGYKNIFVRTGDGYAGWPEHAPFDAIVVTAAPEKVPQALVDQLAVNGKMIVPVGAGVQEMTIITKTERGVVQRRTIPVRFVPMTGKPQ